MIFKIQNYIREHWEELLKDYTGNVCIFQTGCQFLDILDFIENEKDFLKTMDKIIVVVTTEALFSSIWFEIARKLKVLGIDEKDMLFEDRGVLINPRSRNWFHVSNPLIVTNRAEVMVKKDKILLSLARNPRPFRLVMTHELLQKNILPSEKYLITCGCAEEACNWPYFKIIPEVSGKLFPITTFGISTKVDLFDDEINHETVWAGALINLVMESGYNNTYVINPNHPKEYIPLAESWDRYFFTEKTEKAFRYHQVPILVGPAGYVQYLRNLGFDVFDDFIDHSYDEELDPYVRLKLIANEVKRVCDLVAQSSNLEDYSYIISNFHTRTTNNFLNIKNVSNIGVVNRINEVKKFLMT